MCIGNLYRILSIGISRTRPLKEVEFRTDCDKVLCSETSTGTAVSEIIRAIIVMTLTWGRTDIIKSNRHRRRYLAIEKTAESALRLFRLWIVMFGGRGMAPLGPSRDSVQCHCRNWQRSLTATWVASKHMILWNQMQIQITICMSSNLNCFR